MSRSVFGLVESTMVNIRVPDSQGLLVMCMYVGVMGEGAEGNRDRFIHKKLGHKAN